LSGKSSIVMAISFAGGCARHDYATAKHDEQDQDFADSLACLFN
jgi:hypothetical protein